MHNINSKRSDKKSSDVLSHSSHSSLLPGSTITSRRESTQTPPSPNTHTLSSGYPDSPKRTRPSPGAAQHDTTHSHHHNGTHLTGRPQRPPPPSTPFVSSHTRGTEHRRFVPGVLLVRSFVLSSPSRRLSRALLIQKEV